MQHTHKRLSAPITLVQTQRGSAQRVADPACNRKKWEGIERMGPPAIANSCLMQSNCNKESLA